MEDANFYRAKALELTRLADDAEKPLVIAQWTLMARTWADLAVKVDAEERYLRAYDPDWSSFGGIGLKPAVD